MRPANDVATTARSVAALLLGASGLRLLGSVLAGTIAFAQRHDLAAGAQRAGSVLSVFGGAGDTVGALLLVGAAGLVWWSPRRSALFVARALLAVTAALVAMRVIGVLLIDSAFPHSASQDVQVAAFGAADLLLCAAGSWLLTRASAVAGEAGADAIDGAEPEPALFAVDRVTGEVFAFFSRAEARRTLSVYSIEDDEFDFYTDSGEVVETSVVDERAQFVVSDEDRRDVLLAALRRFARAHDLDIPEPGEPAAYAVPVSDWQWLELWPGWLRGVGRVVRRLRR